METPVNQTMQSSTGSNEVIYEVSNINTAGSDESRVMSEKVQMLASAIYKELELMIQKHGQESVKDLMPLVVNVLENLDLAYLEKEEHLVDLEMLKEENEQVLNQFERERQMRKNLEQKFLELEESLVEQNTEMESKVESLESIVRMLELKAKNASDHAARLEEREADQKLEFEKLHERYNDLLRTHIEHVERTKFLMGAEMFDMAQSLPINAKNRNNMAMSVIDTNVRGISDLITAVNMSQSTHTNVNLANHINNEGDWQDEFGQQTAAEILQTPREETLMQAADNKSITEETDEKREVKQNEEKEEVKRTNSNDDSDAISLGADLTGMGREVENLIKENTELLETKNALNIVKNDLIAKVDELSSEHEILREEIRSLEMVKFKLNDKIRELETEIKSLKEKKSSEETLSSEQDDVPMAQRKRFTRVEMARVLMERNQYKEKLIELQEALKFTEMQRAKRVSYQQSSSRTGIWDFFSSLFGDNQSSNSQSHHRNSSQHRKTLATKKSEQLRKKNTTKNLNIEIDSVQEKRLAERRQQYKAVSQHMKKDDGLHTQAYGWSIPLNVDTTSTNSTIPVPVCCRPLLDQQPSLKIWCATSVTLHGGKKKDGNFIVGDSVVGCDPFVINQKDLEKMEDPWLCSTTSLIWVCSSNEKRSFATILDANNPNNILECFVVCASHLLCVASVSGVHESEVRLDEDFRSKLICDGGYFKNIPSDIGNAEFFGKVDYIELRESDCHDQIKTYCSVHEKQSPRRSRDFSVNSSLPPEDIKFFDENTRDNNVKLSDSSSQLQIGHSYAESQNTIGCLMLNTNQKTNILSLFKEKNNQKNLNEVDNKNKGINNSISSLPLHVREALNKYEKLEEVSTALPTVWMGSENNYIFIHSGVVKWKQCLLKIKMLDAVLHILHVNGRVFVALANGSIVVFHRNADGNWSTVGYNVINLGSATSSVCYLIDVNGQIWAAYRNCVVIINPESLKVEHVFIAHPRKDSQVRQMVYVGKGVWLTIRLDSTIRLYHYQTYQHLQDVDVEPYLTKMLGTNKFDFLHLRITALSVMNKRLWIGTGTGVIISVPLSDEINSKVEILLSSNSNYSNNKRQGAPGGLIRVYEASDTKNLTNDEKKKIIPYCNISQAQLSFHGHKDAVRFFLPVLSEGLTNLTLETKKLLMISGGDGYIDFRLGEDMEENSTLRKQQIRIRDMSHLIIWEIESFISTSNTSINSKREE